MKTAMEMLDRMETLVRKMANRCEPPSYVLSATDYTEARAIVAELPEPVDPDLVTARDLAAGVANAYHEPAMVDEYKNGMYDADPEIVAMLAALRRAREEGVR